jgi:hypothetical protein
MNGVRVIALFGRFCHIRNARALQAQVPVAQELPQAPEKGGASVRLGAEMPPPVGFLHLESVRIRILMLPELGF